MWTCQPILRSYDMTTAAIEYIWKAIQESERSDDLSFIDAMARKMLPARSDTLGRESTTEVVADPLQTNSNSLPVVTKPPSAVIRPSLSV
jgi:hypothetical protein